MDRRVGKDAPGLQSLLALAAAPFSGQACLGGLGDKQSKAELATLGALQLAPADT